MLCLFFYLVATSYLRLDQLEVTMNDKPFLLQRTESSPMLRSPVLNTEEAAAYVGLAKSTLEKLRIYGDGPIFTKYSTRVVRYRIEDLDAWIEKHRAASTSELEAA